MELNTEIGELTMYVSEEEAKQWARHFLRPVTITIEAQEAPEGER